MSCLSFTLLWAAEIIVAFGGLWLKSVARIVS